MCLCAAATTITATTATITKHNHHHNNITVRHRNPSLCPNRHGFNEFCSAVSPPVGTVDFFFFLGELMLVAPLKGQEKHNLIKTLIIKKVNMATASFCNCSDWEIKLSKKCNSNKVCLAISFTELCQGLYERNVQRIATCFSQRLHRQQKHLIQDLDPRLPSQLYG